MSEQVNADLNSWPIDLTQFLAPIFGGGYFTHVDVAVDFTDQTDTLEGNHALATYRKMLLVM